MPGDLKLPQATQVLLVVSVCNALQALITSLFVCLFVCCFNYYYFEYIPDCMSRKCVPVSGGGRRGPEPMSLCLPAERLSRWAKPTEVPGRGMRQFQFACFCVHISVQKMLPVSRDGRRGLEPTSLCLPAEHLYRWAKPARYPWYETISVLDVLFSPENVTRLVGMGEEDSNQLPSVYQLSVFPAGPNPW